MISGKLPNDTVWWLSTDGKKIWIESENLEQEKFKEKGCNIVHGRIFYARKEVGELTTSRLDSRKHKDAWIIKLDTMLDVYPGLMEDIHRKEIEEKKKKRKKASHKSKKEPKKELVNKELEKEQNKESEKEIKEDKGQDKELEKKIKEDKDTKIYIKDEHIKEVAEKDEIKRKGGEPIRDYFDINRPYVKWIKDEICKNGNGKLTISLKDLKEKMGDEFIKMHDLRIYFGLNKILSSIGITIELRSIKGESVAIIKKI